MNRPPISRIALLVAAAALHSPGVLRADIVVSTFDPLGVEFPSLLRFDESTGTEFTAAEITAFSGITSPTDIAVGPDGNIYVTDTGTATIRHFDGRTGAPLLNPQSGTPDGIFAARAVPPPDPEEMMQSVTSLAFDANGDLFVVNADLGTVDVYNGETGVATDTLFFGGDVPQPASLAFATFTPGGDLLVSDLGGARVYHVDLSSGPANADISEFVAGTGGAIQIGDAFEVFSPAGLVVDESGAVYVANLFGNDILKFDANGENAEVFATITPPPTEPNPIPGLPPTNYPSNLVLDRDGNILVAVLGEKNTLDNMGNPQETEGRIMRYAPDGTLLETVADGLLPATSLALIDDLLPGDFDGNGIVDEADHTLWMDQYGQLATPTNGADANGDGIVDAADYTVWRDSLGASGLEPQMSLQTSSVPEPASLVMTLAGTLLWLIRRRTPAA